MAGSTQIVSQCLDILRHVQDVLEQYRNGEDHLHRVGQDVQVVIDLVRLIKTVPALHCDEVLRGVGSLKDRAAELRDFIERILPKFNREGALRKMGLVVYLNTNAPRDLKLLEDKRLDLLQAHVGLQSLISVAKFGVRKAENHIFVNVFTVQLADDALRRHKGIKKETLMARFVKECGFSAEQEEATLNEEQLKLLERMIEEALADETERVKEETRQVLNNKAGEYSLMVNAKIGTGTDDRNNLVVSQNVWIEGNTSAKGAFMINDNQSVNGFGMLSEQWVRQAAVSQGATIQVPDGFWDVRERNQKRNWQ